MKVFPCVSYLSPVTGNLSPQTTEDQLRDVFAAVGHVQYVRIPQRHITKKALGNFSVTTLHVLFFGKCRIRSVVR